MLLSCSSVAASADDSAAVNERIPVRNDEMEAHWQVDCQDLWRQLAASVSEIDNCGLSANLQRDLQLCGYIYQPPGETDAGNCPDYAQAYALLKSKSGAGRCNTLKALVDEQAACAVLGYKNMDE